MESMVETHPLFTGEVEQDRVRETAWRAGYDDYLAGSMDNYGQYAHTPLSAIYEKGAAEAVFDVQAGRAAVRTVQDIVIARATTGRGYIARHRRVPA